MPVVPAPTVTAVNSIAAQSEPVLRNLQITQCYFELSSAFARRTGLCANWCTFATWASKQAGQTIRHEDLKRHLELLLQKEPEVEAALLVVATLAKKKGTRQTPEQIRHSALISLIQAAAERAGEAVSRGNKKVFEEIAREFAHFSTACYSDATFNQQHIDDFNRQLRSGPPPNGQEYLQKAFSGYYQSFFEEDPKKQLELRLLANLEVGFHEQTRLQPEIAESLNAAAAIDPQQVKKRLLTLLFPEAGFWERLLNFFQNLFQKNSMLDNAIELLVQRAQKHLRRILTAHLMTLTLPPDNCLQLGQDLTATFPADLKQLANPDLLNLLRQIDPTPDSLKLSGATDWADLAERLHYIADLFRCYHQALELFNPPFTNQQAATLKEGQIPGGRL